MHIAPEDLRRCWFLAGPTASGKSDVALILAEQLGAEIIALDSMTLYRGMDIGTAKPTAAERARVPHHLFDVLDPDEEYSVAEYVTACAAIVPEVLSRDRMPLFVGGTGLYLRSLLRGVFEGPPADWELRRQLTEEMERRGVAVLHERLQAIDPVTAARLSPNDVRRVIRALEVHAVTGRPLSDQQTQPPLPCGLRPPHVYWLEPPRAWLHERIRRRVERMFAAGLTDEVRRLLDGPRPLSHTARQAIGYKEVIDWLEAGSGDPAEVAALIQTRTRQFAKRQHTWFRNLEECTSIAIAGTESPEEIAAVIIEGAREQD
ncbi:MAG: tRNA (adenosine(37)-N6)-dimethylallyltransferase MiaA [Planctomycetaceae bacterium]|nr:tRNA (adenosine(37)-N6)-dimethylallyltransferase MiaA [Planctomycetaceae bacterium]